MAKQITVETIRNNRRGLQTEIQDAINKFENICDVCFELMTKGN